MAIFMQLYAPLVTGDFVGLYPPQEPEPPIIPNPQNLIEGSKATGCNGIVTVPSFIEVWAQSPSNVQYLSTLRILVFAGGPLSDANGGKLCEAGVKLFAVYGGTEFGSPTDVLDSDDSAGLESPNKTSLDWAWMQFGDKGSLRWIPQGDGSYELHFLTCATHHPAIENLEDVAGYATSDLWIPHPTKQGLWKIVGRTDDVIVLGSGEKIVPIPQEGYIGSLAFVSGVVMFGRGQVQAGILIEPRDDSVIGLGDNAGLVAFRNKIWPYIEEANKLAPSFARIFKEMILVTKPDKPMQRAAKGTVMRKLILASYANEIQRLYETIESSTDANGVQPPQDWNVESIETWLVLHATSIGQGKEPSATVDIFEQGFDSLSATYLRNRIIGALRTSSNSAAREAATRVPQNFVFEHPTLQHLAIALVLLIDPEGAQRFQSSEELMESFIEKYTADLPIFTKGQTDASNGTVVLLTGSTGNLGSHILAALLQSSDIKAVYTLDRGTGVMERLKASFQDRGLSVGLLESKKLGAYSADLAKSDLGLDQDVFTKIQQSVSHIIHNAWKLDFNLSISSFESHISGTRQLVNFSAGCTKSVKFLFSSSIAVAQSWNEAANSVPEEILPNPSVAVGSGYGESKYVTEKILAAAKKNGLETMSLRIGQLSGSTTTGAWNVTDWVPITVKSSIALGYLPDLNETVDWTPVDVAARTFVDAVKVRGPLPNLVNLVHPHPTAWSEVFSLINTRVGRTLQIVPFTEWLAKVQAQSTNATEHDFQHIPAIKILRFLQSFLPSDPASSNIGRPLFTCERGLELSPALKYAPSVDTTSVGLWFRYWHGKDVGFA
ncbi:putative PKS/NRPS-like protein biosynthetic cluster [Steccherinum ochraceum]|uniref:Putative PKS/NRPS-like protein biosynthetic cluster n=1 Tax=Steccherinum ochraceum TaxID=92696 RepID=A0A4R0RKG8_9APHY|nr:putative PKS/NRPS-like protein biosynthetic cluster [Steccherinum ochraceum]